jgi:uncharacterized OB-fold protein
MGVSIPQEDLSGPPPLRADLFMTDPHTGVPGLRGSRCAHCGRVYFPVRAICADCFDEGGMNDHPLDRYGVVHACTTVRVPSAAGHKPPYACGYVELAADSLRVYALFSGGSPEVFVPGLEVELSVAPARIGALGEVLAYTFVPRTGG